MNFLEKIQEKIIQYFTLLYINENMIETKLH